MLMPCRRSRPPGKDHRGQMMETWNPARVRVSASFHTRRSSGTGAFSTRKRTRPGVEAMRGAPLILATSGRGRGIELEDQISDRGEARLAPNVNPGYGEPQQNGQLGGGTGAVRPGGADQPEVRDERQAHPERDDHRGSGGDGI